PPHGGVGRGGTAALGSAGAGARERGTNATGRRERQEPRSRRPDSTYRGPGGNRTAAAQLRPPSRRAGFQGVLPAVCPGRRVAGRNGNRSGTGGHSGLHG